MSRLIDHHWRPGVGFLAVLVSGILLLASAEPALAGPRDRRPGDNRPPMVESREFRDSRYHHDRVYPARGVYVPALPRDRRVVVHRNTRYYFHGGAWYRPWGSRFVVVAPPIGLFVPFLPPFYTTVWVSRVPYYYSNDVYYTHYRDGYVVVAPPKEDPSQTPPPADELFIYPRQGQSEQQQADDRFACHQWAVEQTGFDPTRPADGAADARQKKDRADYQRAMGACLDGRGYTVK